MRMSEMRGGMNMVVSRRGFLRFSLGSIFGFLIGSMLGSVKSLFAEVGTVEVPDGMYKAGDKVPKAGRYQCVVCGLIVEYLPKHIEKGATFGICTLCQAGTEKGPKKPNEAFWKPIY